METLKQKKYILLLLSIAWVVIIFVLCTMPANDLPKVKFPHIDKIVHFSFFFVLSVLFSLLFNFQKKSNYLTIILLSTLLAFSYGGLIEILQNKFFNRTGDIFDLTADVVGGFVGAMVYPTIRRMLNRFF